MSAMESIDTRSLASKAREITKRELGDYMKRTAGSMRATERARKVMPLGVPSSFQAYDPHPIVVKRAQAESWAKRSSRPSGDRASAQPLSTVTMRPSSSLNPTTSMASAKAWKLRSPAWALLTFLHM